MAENIAIFRDAIASFSEVQTFYASVGYFQVVTADCIVISARCRDTIVGVVRLSPENGVQVLRGMRIAPSAIPSFFEIKEASGGALFPKRIGSWVFEPRIDCKLERGKRTGESARIIFISG